MSSPIITLFVFGWSNWINKCCTVGTVLNDACFMELFGSVIVLLRLEVARK